MTEGDPCFCLDKCGFHAGNLFYHEEIRVNQQKLEVSPGKNGSWRTKSELLPSNESSPLGNWVINPLNEIKCQSQTSLHMGQSSSFNQYSVIETKICSKLDSLEKELLFRWWVQKYPHQDDKRCKVINYQDCTASLWHISSHSPRSPRFQPKSNFTRNPWNTFGVTMIHQS